MIEYTDWRGNIIRIGDTVLYPSLVGRTAQMTEGTVQDIYCVERNSYLGKWVRTDERPSDVNSVKWRINILPTRDSLHTYRYADVGTYEGKKVVAYKTVTILNVVNVTKI